jgi:hypothetical protein
VYTDSGGVYVMEDNKCACGCGEEISKSRKGKKFLNKVHRDRYHSRPKTKSSMDAFVKEVKTLSDKLNQLLKTYWLDR